MHRRHAITVAATTLAALARAQGTKPAPIIGWLGQHRGEQRLVDIFTAKLEHLGLVRGRDFVIESRLNEDPSRRAALAAELLALRPALVLATGNHSIAAVKALTTSIPIVMFGAAAPVAVGFVRSLASPGGNITGISYHPVEVGGKMVELLRAAAPRVGRVTLIWNPDFPGLALYKPHFDSALARLKIESNYFDVRRADDFSPAAVMARRPEALIAILDPVVSTLYPAIARLALEHRLPTMSAHRLFTQEGGLLALLPDVDEMAQNTADIVARILRGAKPADIAVREPTRFQLIVNQRTARSIGLALPRDLLLQASEVLE